MAGTSSAPRELPSPRPGAAALDCPARVLSEGHVTAPSQVSHEFAETVLDWVGRG